MLSNEQMAEMSYDLDSYLVSLSEKYQLEPLTLSAVVLARLIRITEEFGDAQNFHVIMKTAIASRLENSVH